MFANRSNHNQTIASPCGEDIYTWDYVDDDGNFQTNTENVYEKIQSGGRLSDYKTAIKRGEDYGLDNGAVYMDISNVGTDFDAVDSWLQSVADSLKAIKNTKNIEVTTQSGKTVDTNQKSANEATGQTEQGGKN